MEYRVDFTEGKILRTLQELNKLTRINKIKADGIEIAELLSGTQLKEIWNMIEAGALDWRPFDDGDRWGGRDKHFCFRLKAVLPESFSGRTVLLEVRTGREGGWAAFNPQFVAFVNGVQVHGLDINHTEIELTNKLSPNKSVTSTVPNSSEAGNVYSILLHAYAGTMDGLMDLMTDISVLDDDVERLYYNIKVAYDTAHLLDKNNSKRYDLLDLLINTVNLIDFSEPQSDTYYNSISAANSYIENELYSRDWGNTGVTTHCVGHTHIDVAWIWTLSQTREKAQRSFSTVLHLMNKYSGYNFMSSQPVLYQFVKEDNPKLYEGIKERVREGRWEAEGGMWLEADCNLTSGESLVRQILFGKRFFKNEFGVDNNVLWLPDAFGYTAALPQIMKKSGLDYFLSSKLSWNEFNRFPYDTFHWEGIDGSRVLSYFITTPDDVGLENTPDFSTYNGTMKAKNILGTWQRYLQKENNKDILFCFGYGDGGGGPTKDMLEYEKRLEKGLPEIPNVKISSIKEFFGTLKSNEDSSKPYPRWVGELYFEYHRGTYTTMGKSKWYNRKSEQLYQAVEWAGSLNAALSGAAYPQAEINKNWQLILLNQFHDVLPGSAIHAVYEESHRQYEGILKSGMSLLNGSLDSIVHNVQTTDDSIIVFNSLGFDRSDVVETELRFTDSPADCGDSGLNIELYDDLGNIIDYQVLSESNNIQKIVFYAENVPAMGYRAYKVVKKDADPACNDGDSAPYRMGTDLFVTTGRMENKFYVIKFDDNGRITSIYDKKAEREVLKPDSFANSLCVFEDKPMTNDAWNVDVYYDQKMWRIDSLDSIEVLETGPVYGSVMVKRRFLDSIIEQEIRIYRDRPGIDFITAVDWKQSQMLLKAFFPVDIHANEAVYDIQFGNIKRPTHTNTSWEQAQFEVWAHKWADLSEDGYGVSLMNDCKYGYSIRDGVIGITLIKSPVDPNPLADKEMHHFTYSLYPHEGDWRAGAVPKAAYSLNSPMLSKPVPANPEGCLPVRLSFIHADQDNIIIETVKKAEDSDSLIIRLYECYNRRTLVNIELFKELRSVSECTLMEEELNDVVINGDSKSFSVIVKPYEIKTYKVLFK